jgi:TPR repeat protein
MHRYLVLLALCLAFNAHATDANDPVAQAIGRADEYTARNEFATAIGVLEPFETLQRADVDFALAYALYLDAIDGKPVEDAADAELSRALALAERSAATGNGYALNLLFVMYTDGAGIPVDEAKAVAYLDRAVAAGDVGAKLNYATRLFVGGTLLGKDRDKACRLFEELQVLPDPEPISSYYLGVAHLRGECGYPQDYAQGVALIEVAARGEVREAQSDMGKSFEFGWAGETDLAQALAWYHLAAELGEPHAQWRIGLAYVEGERRSPDPVLAVQWFEQSAASGHPLGLASLAVMVATGDGTAQDFARARSLYQRSAEAGNPHAYRGLAVMNLLGEGGPPDPVRAWVLYSLSVAAGNPKEPALLEQIESQLDRKQRKQARREFEALRGAL